MQLLMLTLTRLVLTPLLLTRLALAGPARPRDQRGDVPGWVLVTVMTAGLVMVIWGVADDQLSSMLSTALAKVR